MYVSIVMYHLFIKPFFYLLPAEAAHHLGLLGARLIGWLYQWGVWRRGTWASDPSFQVDTSFGAVSCPVGLAAGFDKNAEALWGWEALGFGFVEIGTVTPLPQMGNPKPRLFRFIGDHALVNRMGFNNQGVKKISENIRKARRKGLKIKIGGNIGKNFSTSLEKAALDYKLTALQLADCVDYLVINVSSPNTPGLRKLQNEKFLESIIVNVRSVAEDKPLFIKIAPDDFERFMDGILYVIKKYKLAGLICGNTLANHASAVGMSDIAIACLPTGGLSGQPILEINLKMVQKYIDRDRDLLVVGVGGIGSGQQALSYLESGAGLVQVFSGFVFGGPGFVKKTLKEMEALGWRVGAQAPVAESLSGERGREI